MGFLLIKKTLEHHSKDSSLFACTGISCSHLSKGLSNFTVATYVSGSKSTTVPVFPSKKNPLGALITTELPFSGMFIPL